MRVSEVQCVSPLYRTVCSRVERGERERKRGEMGLVPLCFVLLLAISQPASAAVEDGKFLDSLPSSVHLMFLVFVHGSSISAFFFGLFFFSFC